jgi:hypothetical protein
MEVNCNSSADQHISHCASKLFNFSHSGRIIVAWIKDNPPRPFPVDVFICAHFDFTFASLARFEPS